MPRRRGAGRDGVSGATIPSRRLRGRGKIAHPGGAAGFSGLWLRPAGGRVALAGLLRPTRGSVEGLPRPGRAVLVHQRPHLFRQLLIIVGNSLRYWYARPAFDSPWYQIAPWMPYGINGAIIALYNPEGECGCPGPIGAYGRRGGCFPSAFACSDAFFHCSTRSLYLTIASG